ncbi:MAG TPA: SulP family inorganic anion transporter [Polyangiaceae bacterium]|nr:SulP family inorganic anion transporter [Polyangiaceae bacterium]
MMTSPSTEVPRSQAYWRDSAALTWRSWLEMFERRSLAANLAAGLTIALVALPLNLALAIACGLPPSVGLVSGAVAGAVGALLGGSRLQVTGPEVALAPVTLLIVADEGPQGLLVATFLCGVFQIGFGLMRLGGVVRRIPRPVIAGFMTAIGLLVFDSQLPRLLGLPSEVGALHALTSLSPLHHVDLRALVIGAVVVATLLLAPRLLPRVPAPLLGLGVATLLAFALPGVPTVAPLDAAFPTPGLPDFAASRLTHLIPEALALALLASLDSLLCAASVDARTGGAPTRNDQELVAQGFANMASACFGGMPVAAAVVRSMAAIEARASTRLAPLVQSLCLGAALLAFGTSVSAVPLVALAAILLVVGYRLIDVQFIRRLWSLDPWEAAILLATAGAILFTDFVSGVVVGCALALVRFAWSMTRALAIRSMDAGPSLDVLRIEGPLFFASQTLLDSLRSRADAARPLLVDLSGITAADSTGAVALRTTLEGLAAEERPIWLANFPDDAPWLRAELEQTRAPWLRVAPPELAGAHTTADDTSVPSALRAAVGALRRPLDRERAVSPAPIGGE